MPGIGPVPVLNEGFLQIGISAYTQHDQAVPPVPPAPVPMPGVPGIIEGPAFMGWPPGMLSHKTAPKVLSDGNPAVQHGHDIGYMIPHIQAPVNALMAVHTMLSKHKIVFPVNATKLGGKPAGTYLFFLIGEICSNPVSLPTGIVILIKTTVWTSMSFMDLLLGVTVLLIDFVFDKVWNKLKGFLPKLPGQKSMEVLGGLTFFEMIEVGGGPLIARYLLREGANKVFQHIVKSWIVSPLVTGLPFGKSGIGRGNWAYHSFLGGKKHAPVDHDH
jgi:hypothetical protein